MNDGTIRISLSNNIINAGEIIIAINKSDNKVNDDSKTTSLHIIEPNNNNELFINTNIIINIKNNVTTHKFK